MDKKKIWLIIFLMTAGIIGTASIQIYWFKESMKIQEKKFENNVFTACYGVVEKIEEDYKKRRESILNITNSPTSSYFNIGLGSPNRIKRDILSRSMPLSDSTEIKSRISLFESLDQNQRKWAVYEERYLNQPEIEDRIVDLDKLDSYMKAELKSLGIDIDYDYGIYSNTSESFVIINGNYVAAGFDDSVLASNSGVNNSLDNSPYEFEMFLNENPTPGKLAIHFPDRSTLLWSSLVSILLGTLFFAGLILFCFGYTIYVIFVQKKVSEMKNDFINNMTHEFKTPIATISLAADSITNPKVSQDTSKVQRFAGIIKQENKRMLSQVEKVLQMAVLDRKDFSLKLSQVDLNRIITQAVDHTNLQVQKRGGKVLKQLNANEAIIEGDATHISNIIHNLLDNANKYSPEEPEITLYTRNLKDGVEVIVEDKGIGMTKEALKHIFDKFYRVHTGNLHDVKGFGLGLSYVKAIMTAHQGEIAVKSEVGKGSSFILHFPFKQRA